MADAPEPIAVAEAVAEPLAEAAPVAVAEVEPIAEVAPIAVAEAIAEPSAEVESIGVAEVEAEPIAEEPIAVEEAVAEPDGGDATDAFATLVQALGDVALASGATRAAAVIGELIDHGHVSVSLLSEAATRTLVARGWASAASGTLTLSSATQSTLAAWRSVLRGESADFEACGDSTLDAWCAELLAAVSGTPERAGELRRALRAQGVAAFGLIAQAA